MKKISRLQETDYSSFNLRDAYITSQADYIAALRDEAMFSNYGIKVLVRVPCDETGELNENNIDEYSNFVDIEWSDSTETVIPKFTDYRQNLSEDGMTADGTDGLYPLEVLIPSKLHLPRNSRIIFNEYNSREEKVAREWVVLGTQMKQLSGSKTYSRVANCVPARKNTYEVTNDWCIELNFTASSSGINKISNIRAQGNIWFDTATITNEQYKKVIKNVGPEGETEVTSIKYLSPEVIEATFEARRLTASVLN